MNTITVEKRNDDYLAYLNGDKALWDCGKTQNEAIANLVRTFPNTLGLVIEYPKEQNNHAQL